MFVFLIKQIREEQKISQQELAVRLNISRSYLSKIESNKEKNVSFDLVLKISEALNVDIKKIYVTDRNIEELRNILHNSIDKYGINHEKTIEISHLIDILINTKMEENNKK